MLPDILHFTWNK